MSDTPQTPTLREQIDRIIEAHSKRVNTGNCLKNEYEVIKMAVNSAFEQYLTDGALPEKDTTIAEEDYYIRRNNEYYNQGLEAQREAYLKGLKSE